MGLALYLTVPVPILQQARNRNNNKNETSDGSPAGSRRSRGRAGSCGGTITKRDYFTRPVLTDKGISEILTSEAAPAFSA